MVKLGLASPVLAEDEERPALTEEFIKLLAKTVSTLRKKFAESKAGALLVLGRAFEDVRPKKLVCGPAATPSESTGITALKESEPDGSQAAMPSATELCQQDVSVGSQVVTISFIHKEKYDNMLSEVMAVNRSTVKLELLQGPCKNEYIKRNYKQIKPKGAEGDAGTSAAGFGGMRPSAENTEPPAKRAAAEGRADAIFGSTRATEDND